MRKLMILSLLFTCFLFCSCSNTINKKSASKVTYGMSLNDVINILGEPNEIKLSTPNKESNCYYWFNNASSLREAKRLAKKGKRIYYIAVLTYTDDIVIGKSAGIVTEDLEYGEILVYA